MGNYICEQKFALDSHNCFNFVSKVNTFGDHVEKTENTSTTSHFYYGILNSFVQKLERLI